MMLTPSLILYNLYGLSQLIFLLGSSMECCHVISGSYYAYLSWQGLDAPIGLSVLWCKYMGVRRYDREFNLN